MAFREGIRQFVGRMFQSERGQRFLDRLGSHVDLWRGYGAGAYVDTSGETVLFDLVRERFARADNFLIFDVGANVGEFSAAAFDALGRNVMIHAFEPARDVFRELSGRFAGNDRIVLNNVALGREAGERALFGSSSDSGMASLFQRKLDGGDEPKFQEIVKVVRLDDYCARQKIERI